MVVNTKPNQQEAEESLYTILGFKGQEDFQGQTDKMLGSDNRKLKKLRAKLFGKCKKKVRIDEENNQAAKKVNDQIKKSKTIESKLSDLLEFKKQLKAFLKDQDNRGIVLNKIDSDSTEHVVEVSDIHTKRRANKRLRENRTLTSNREDFEQALGYIELQEKAMGITLEELAEYKKHRVKIFLLDHINSSRSKHFKLHCEVGDAITILSNDELRTFYDKEVEKKTLQPILSYGECKQVYDKMNRAKNESHVVIEKEELRESVRTVMGVKCFMNESSRENQKSGTSPTETSTNYRQKQVASSDSRTLGSNDMPSLGKSIESSQSDLFVPFEAPVNTSTPIKPTNPSNLVTTGEDYTNYANLSDELGVSGINRIVEPVELVANSLIKIKEIAEQQSNTALSEEVIVLERYVKGLMGVTEGIIVDIGERLVQNDSKNMPIEPGLKVLKEMNKSLDDRVQELQKEVDRLEEENKGFLAKNDKLKEKLATAEEEKELLFDEKEKIQEVINVLNENNRQLQQKISGLEDDYRYLRAEETKRETKDSCIQVGKADIPEGKAELGKDYESKLVKLEQEIDAKGRRCEELLLENSILRSNLEQSKAENKRLEGIEESLSIDASHFCSGENLHNELILANEQPKNIDRSIQAKMESKVAPEVVDINVTQGYSKRVSNLSQVPEQSSAVKSQFSEASAQSRKQIICASASLILSGAFAIGTSLTMSHLGISIGLALAALTFLTLGCYCSYKASTILSNIKPYQTVKMVDHEAVFMAPSL
ncbi:hypothetical protein [Wolbachia endosymbiont of Armadillidium arcangelii]|uniref:Uncharacterized protein n=1 Tax=Wolbachia endosymbiont of Armadillidium arcangelii TaxID=3158571 RepID=A0AAU7Q2L0_9RICK